jgi:hypothetical protein
LRGFGRCSLTGSNVTQVLDGSGDFNGVAGKILLTNVQGTTTTYHFALVG